MSQADALQKQEDWGTQVVTLMNRPDRVEHFRNLLGSDDAVERFKTVALHSIIRDSNLRNCEPMSIVEAVRESAVLGLEPTGILGEAWILPYGKLAQLRPGWQGLLKLVRNTGQVAAVDCQVVYEKDIFDVEYGTNSHVRHIPYLVKQKDDTRGNYLGAYAWARLNNGELLVEWMSYADIEQVRKSSPARDNGPWVTFWSEMARKTPLRRLIKRLPKSAQLIRALELDATADEAERALVTPPPAQALSPARQQAMAALEAHYPNVVENSPETTSEDPVSQPEPESGDEGYVGDAEAARLVSP